MELALSTPSILFPAVSLLLLAYTNRFLAIAAIIRNLYARYQQEGGRAVPPGGVAGEADVRAEHDGAVGDRRRVVAGTLVVVVSAFGTPAGEVHEETIASAI